ncbi:MAG: helix-turn-helix domain-containing protein [Burkholderiaceae bacterium]|nr:helix-turn-helix domain-containing protein [Burkholderiaceae bacterium]
MGATMHAVHCHDLNAWNRAARRTFGDIAVEAHGAHFVASMTARDWTGVRLIEVDSPAACVSGARHGGREGWYLLCNRDGGCRVTQGGLHADLDAGECSLLRADAPWQIQFDQRNRMRVAVLGLAQMPNALALRCAARHTRKESALLAGLIERSLRAEAQAAARLDAHALQRALLDLMLLAQPLPAAPGSAVPASGRASPWWPRIDGIVQRDLDDPQLDAHAIARELRLSTRQVQAVAAQRGTTVSAHILEQRLQRAAQRLKHEPDRRIADIAFHTGFNDLSHFCRSFQRRFGVSARDWRREH